MARHKTEAGTITLHRQQFGPGVAAFTPRDSHLLVLKLTRTSLSCRIADRHLRHETRFGHFALLPQDADCSASLDVGMAHTLTLTIGSRSLAEFADEGGAACQPRDILRGDDVGLTRIALEIEAVENGDATRRDELSSQALALIVERYANRRPSDLGGPLGSAAFIAVRGFIFDNIGGDLSLATLASIAHLSPYHFSRAFSRATGVPPHRYIMQARTDQATAAIRDRRGDLAEIAYEHGFTDQSHMCRWIRRRYGATPREVRGAESIG